MIISDKFILIGNPKTASRAMRISLGNFGHIENLSNHEKSAFAVKKRHPQKWKKCLTVGFCRNPYDRMVSIFADFANLRKCVHVNFKQWLKTLTIPQTGTYAILQPQYWYLGENGFADEIAVNFLGRYETLNNDWQRFGNLIGESLPKLELVHNSHHKPYQYFYDKESIEIVQNFYQKDFKLFNYPLNM